MDRMSLDREFFERDTAVVAKELLGKTFTHREEEQIFKGKIVETEAYFGLDDPASRAEKEKTKINENMWKKGGTTLVYMVHSYWLFNIATEGKDIPGAILIRAVEPLKGIDIMKDRRGRDREKELASGPGKFTQAFGISKDHHGMDVTSSEKLLVEEDGEDVPASKIGTSHRIGVTEDLERELRFFIKDNAHVSR